MTAPWMKRKWEEKSLSVNSRLPDCVSLDVKECDEWVGPYSEELLFPSNKEKIDRCRKSWTFNDEIFSQIFSADVCPHDAEL